MSFPPSHGIRKFRFGPFALVDLAATMIVASLLEHFVPKLNSLVWFIVLWVIGTGLHLLLGIRTGLTELF